MGLKSKTSNSFFGNRLKTVLLALILTLFVLVFFFSRKGYTQNPSYLSGDEPHYIMMTDSLAKDGDFNLKNDYELGRSLNYYPVPGLYPHISSVIDTKTSNKWYSIHTIGLPFVLYLPYKAFGVAGARVWMIILQISTVLIFYLILRKYIKSERQQIIGLGLLVTCPVIWQNLGGMYPDMILVFVWGLILLLFGREDWLSNLLMLGLVLLGTLLHSKGLVLIGPLAFFQVLWLIRKNGFLGWLKRYWAILGVVAFGFLYYVYFLHSNYGIISPTQLYGHNVGGSQLFSANPATTITALLTDRSKGMFVNFPLILISGPYLWLGGTRLVEFYKSKKLKIQIPEVKRYLIYGLSLGLSCSLVTILTFNDWSGSTAPNGRTILPFIFVLVFLVASYVNIRNKVELFILACAGLLGAWLSWLSIDDFRYYMSTGVNSFWVDRFHPLMRLPLFSLVVKTNEIGYLHKGFKILFLVFWINVGLIVLYKYQVILKKRV